MVTELETRKLDAITDNLMMLFPLFYRNMLGISHSRSGVTRLNMEVRAMFMLTNNGILPTSEIGRKLGISKPNVTSLLDKLVDRGFVERLPDEIDHRVINIAVTARGRQAVARKKQALRKVMKDNMSILRHDEIEALSSALEVVGDMISRIGGRH